jgi:hypothetical protein
MVYQYKHWDNLKGDFVFADHMGTLEGIKAIKGTRIEDSGVEIDDALLGCEEPGLTDKGFEP